MENTKSQYARGKHPKSLENLKKGQFKPGKSGNPNGRRPNIKYITELARAKINSPCPYAPGKTWGEYIVDRWFGQVLENPSYFKELMDRLEGKVLQPLGNEDGSPLTIQVNVNSNSTKENIGDVISRLSSN